MAGRAQEALEIRVPPELPPVPEPVPDSRDLPKVEIEVDEVMAAAARLYGLGYKRSQVQEILLDHIAPKGRIGKRDRTREEQQSLARNKLRRWEKSQKFRDLLYQHAVVQLDLETPAILQGVAKVARRGRVDAARLALEVTGRHNPKGDDKPTEITVHIGNIPRPA